MKSIVFFMTHKTLTLEHARATISSMMRQTFFDKVDVLYIYNSQQDVITNNQILALVTSYDLELLFKEIKIFDYNSESPKTLASDMTNIIEYCRQTYAPEDRILFLKSDIVLSRNYFDDMMTLPEGDVFFTTPFVCAKQRVSDDDILTYSRRASFVSSDDITFYVEDQTNSDQNDFHNRPGVDVSDEAILFTSCRVNTDFSCHYITNWLTRRITLQNQSWGGVKFGGLLNQYVGSDRSFTIHKYHGIQSENRAADREGPVAEWLHS